jgi:hypothetical protein
MEEIYARQSTVQIKNTTVGKGTLQETLVRLGWSNEDIITIDDADVIGQQSCNERASLHRLYQAMQQRRFAAQARYN